MLWVPDIYGPLEDMHLEAKGMELVPADCELWDETGLEETGSEQDPLHLDIGDLRESWEVCESLSVSPQDFLLFMLVWQILPFWTDPLPYPAVAIW